VCAEPMPDLSDLIESDLRDLLVPSKRLIDAHEDGTIVALMHEIPVQYPTSGQAVDVLYRAAAGAAHAHTTDNLHP
jgi:hypothetical protein